jgi:putative ATPase
MNEIDTLPEEQAERFAGRELLYARLQQHILDPANRHAIIYTGHEGMGKTALLQHFSSVFDDTMLSFYVSLEKMDLRDEENWLQHLIGESNQLLGVHNFSLSRVPSLETEDIDEANEISEISLKDWMRDTYLTEILHIIRPHRRLVWLFDDAEYLLNASDEHLSYLHNLLEKHPQLAIVLTLDTEHEDKLSQLAPLVNPTTVERIHRLSYDESADLIRQYAPGAEDSSIKNIFEATGGHPRLLARFGQELQKRWTEQSDSQALEAAKKVVYEASLEEFREIWLSLSRDERLVLTGIASLIYDDPLRQVMPKFIENWLIETDYPMDIVAISAALRSLDYRDIVSQHQNHGTQLVMALMQRWLLEHARLDDTDNNSRGRVSVQLVVIVLLAIVLLIALFLLLPNPIISNSTGLATATLSG